MEELPKLSNEQQLWIMSQVKDGKMTVDQAIDHVKQNAQCPSSPTSSPVAVPKKKKGSFKASDAHNTQSSPTSSPQLGPKKKKGSIKSTVFYGEGKVQDVPPDSISAPIIPIDSNGGADTVPTVTFDQQSQDIRKKGDEERLKILDLVKSGQMTIDDALKYADDAGLSSSAQREADTIANTTSAVLEQKAYVFPVYKAGKVRSQVRRILQIDFKNKTISSIQRGNVVKKYNFSETAGYETDEGVHFTIMFTDDHDMDYDADSPEERYEICRLISIILKLNKADIRKQNGTSEQDYWRELPKLQVVMKEGELEKKGGGAFTVWNKRWVRVRRGECSYYRPGEQTALNIVQLAEGTTAITKFDDNGFILIGKVKQYVFRIPAGDRSLDQQRWERDQWIKVLLEASHNEEVKPSGGLDFVRIEDGAGETVTTPADVVRTTTQLRELCQALQSLKLDLKSCSVTDDVLSQVDRLLGLANQIEEAPAPPVETTGVTVDLKRPSRFIPPEANLETLTKTVDEKLALRKSAEPPPKPPRRKLSKAPADESAPTEPGTPRPKLPESPAEESQKEIVPTEPSPEVRDLPPSLPEKKRLSGLSIASSMSSLDRMSNLSGTSVTSSRLERISGGCGEMISGGSGWSSPEISAGTPPLTDVPVENETEDEVFDVPPKPVPVPRKSVLRELSLDETNNHPLQESSPTEAQSSVDKDDDDDRPTLRKKVTLSTIVPIQEPGSNPGDQPRSDTESVKTVKSEERHQSDVDGRVSDAVKEFEELTKETDEEMRSIPHKGSIKETENETVIIAAPPPAPLLPPPPPAPPGLGGLFSSNKKIKRTASTKMKPLHWDKVPKNLYNKSMWKKADDLTDVIDHPLLEEMFAEDKLSATKVETTSSMPEKKSRTLLDAKRAQNLGIVLAGLKMGVDQLQEKLNLIREEDGALPIEQVAMLRRLQPTPDDIEMYRAYKGDKGQLEAADQFLIKLGEIPQLSVRLDILNDIMELPAQYNDLEPSVRNLSLACTELMEAKKFVRVLEYVLAVGNYMNSGAGKPAVEGFQLSSLNKLVNSRGKDKKYTLLHYLVHVVSKCEPELINFYKDMSHINDCTELSIAGLGAEVEVMKRYPSKIQKNAKSLKKLRSPTLESRFQQDVQSFINEYEKLLKQLGDLCSDVGNKFKKAMEFYGEPSDRDTEDILPAVSEFIANFRKIQTEQERKQQTPAKALAGVMMKGVVPNPAMLKKAPSTSGPPVASRKPSTPSESGKPSKEGYLDKYNNAGTIMSKWEKRFVEVSATGYLHYYKKQFDKNLGSVYLKGCPVSIETDDPTVITIETDERQFKLRAKSKNEADDWYNTMVYYGDKK